MNRDDREFSRQAIEESTRRALLKGQLELKAEVESLRKENADLKERIRKITQV